MKLMQHVTIITAKLEESIKFYQDVVGMHISGDLRGKAPKEIVFLSDDDNGANIELVESLDEPYQGSGISLGFHTENVDNLYAELKSKGYELSPILSPMSGTKMFFTKDPNGVQLQFM